MSELPRNIIEESNETSWSIDDFLLENGVSSDENGEVDFSEIEKIVKNNEGVIKVGLLGRRRRQLFSIADRCGVSTERLFGEDYGRDHDIHAPVDDFGYNKVENFSLVFFLSDAKPSEKHKEPRISFDLKYNFFHTKPNFNIANEIGPEAFTLEDIRVTDENFKNTPSELKKQATVNYSLINSVEDASEQPLSLKVSYKKARKMLETLLKPFPTFEGALVEIDEIVQQFNLPEKEVEDLKRAVDYFGKYYSPDPKSKSGKDPSNYRGGCEICTYQFISICKERFGLNISIGKYGGFSSYTEKDMDDFKDELAETGSDDWSGPSQHVVGVFADTIVIDWTARQFDKHAPLPFVYKVGEKGKLFKERLNEYKSKVNL